MIEPEEKTPWLRLARLSEDHEANKWLWNGYQKYLLKPYAGDYQRKLENPKFKEIAELSDADILYIQTKIQDLPTDSDPFGENDIAADIQEIKMPLNLEGFYFAFPVWVMGKRFTASLNLENTQFSHGAKFSGCVFENIYGLASLISNGTQVLRAVNLMKCYLSALQHLKWLISDQQALKL